MYFAGQAVPPGLHVRMNLQTGLTEAKLLDREEEESRAIEESQSAIVSVEPSKISHIILEPGQNSTNQKSQHNIVLNFPEATAANSTGA